MQLRVRIEGRNRIKMFKYSKFLEKSEKYFAYDISDSLARIVEFTNSRGASFLSKNGLDPIFIAIILAKFIPTLSLDISKNSVDKQYKGDIKNKDEGGALIKKMLTALKKSNIKELKHYIEENQNFVLNMYFKEYIPELYDGKELSDEGSDKLKSYLELLDKGTVINLFADRRIKVNKYGKGQNVNYDLYIKAIRLIYLYLMDNNKDDEEKTLEIMIKYILPFFPKKDFNIFNILAKNIATNYEINDDEELQKIKEIIINGRMQYKSDKEIAEDILNITSIDVFVEYKKNKDTKNNYNSYNKTIKEIGVDLNKENKVLSNILRTNIDNYKKTGIDNKLLKNYAKYGLLQKVTEIDGINIKELKSALKELKKEYDEANQALAIILDLLIDDTSGFEDIWLDLNKDSMVMLIMFFRDLYKDLAPLFRSKNIKMPSIYYFT
jgi:hypothetical protein